MAKQKLQAVKLDCLCLLNREQTYDRDQELLNKFQFIKRYGNIIDRLWSMYTIKHFHLKGWKAY